MKNKYREIIKDVGNITVRQFVKESGERVQFVREAIIFHKVDSVFEGGGSVASIYKTKDLWGAVESYRKYLNENKITRAECSRRLANEKGLDNWTGFSLGTRLRITNCAGRQWVGIFDRYNEVFGYIKLQNGEMLFARDAVLEEVDKSVELSYDDGIAPTFVNDIRG